jgi:hypothetical protein
MKKNQNKNLNSKACSISKISRLIIKHSKKMKRIIQKILN